MDMEFEYTNEHRAILELLPWYVNNSLPEAEKKLLLTHLKDCISCRAELKQLNILSECLRADEERSLDDQAFAELMQRIDHAEANSVTSMMKSFVAYPARCWGEVLESAKSVRWLVAAQFVVLLFGGVFFASTLVEQPVAQYKTLSSSQAFVGSKTKLRIVFSEQAKEKDLRAIIRSLKATIISGPSEKGVYTLALLSSAQKLSVDDLTELRASEYVQFVDEIMMDDESRF